ncbi:PREDICTED: hydroquinone glucosyltransferase-like [Ipomoea nil]|uniref:hydroquinone glucosyltransferase-like n=1 Tax=Ipomoea nil TaxID=35883 RepID=UPI000901F492|nr:PREDICTED: hydroquinone glucosyltransferase-like [Ipomoea nil]
MEMEEFGGMTHIAMLPSPGMGHLIPFAELAERLIRRHNLAVTLIVPTDRPLSAPQEAFLGALPAGVDYLVLPPVNLEDLAADTKPEIRICLTVTRCLPALRGVFEELVASETRPPPVALVVDLFSTDAFQVADEFGVSPYIFFPASAMVLSFATILPELDLAVSCEYRDMPEPVQIPGFSVPVHGKDFLDPVQDRQDDAYRWIVYHNKRIGLAKGLILNSFKELEQGPIEALQRPGNPPVYPIGPLVQMDSDSSGECLKWLDAQPPGSVLFICFGSGGCLSHHQLTELALGLEMSQQRFLWVIRSPSDTAAAAFFSAQNPGDPLTFLPQGFLERTKNLGLVVPNWAPQSQILNHRSTAGFLTHCGWNSTLESVVRGVPLIAWPLYAEQKMNAVALTEDIKVALRPMGGENGVVGREEIAQVVKSLMEGEEGKTVRQRMRELMDAAATALSEDGSSTKALSELASIWKKKMVIPP